MKPVFYGIGVGPGDPDLLTLKAVKTIESCPVLAVPQTPAGHMLALEVVRQRVSLENKVVLPLFFAMSRDAGLREKCHRAAAEQCLRQLREGASVGMLNIGDVSLYATFQYIGALIREGGYETAMIPGVPSFCAVAARLGESLTPAMDTPLHIVPADFPAIEAALDYPGTKVIMKAGKSLSALRELLKGKKLREKTRGVQNCGLPEETVLGSLEEAEENGKYFTILVVKP